MPSVPSVTLSATHDAPSVWCGVLKYPCDALGPFQITLRVPCETLEASWIALDHPGVLLHCLLIPSGCLEVCMWCPGTISDYPEGSLWSPGGFLGCPRSFWSALALCPDPLSQLSGFFACTSCLDILSMCSQAPPFTLRFSCNVLVSPQCNPWYSEAVL